MNDAIRIAGSTSYVVENQFFEITVFTDDFGNPLFYQHQFEAAGVENITVQDMAGNAVSGFILRNGILYHNLDGAAYWVQYYADGILRKELPRYLPVLTRAANPSTINYSFTPGGLLTVFSPNPYFIRFTQNNPYSILPPYSVPSNDPWYARVRFNLRPVAKEWARQNFTPFNPFMLATWVPGKILGPNLVEFERQPAYFDGKNYPDILVYDKDYNIKYALDGSEPDSRIDKGYLFP